MHRSSQTRNLLRECPEAYKPSDHSLICFCEVCKSVVFVSKIEQNLGLQLATFRNLSSRGYQIGLGARNLLYLLQAFARVAEFE